MHFHNQNTRTSKIFLCHNTLSSVNKFPNKYLGKILANITVVLSVLCC